MGKDRPLARGQSGHRGKDEMGPGDGEPLRLREGVGSHPRLASSHHPVREKREMAAAESLASIIDKKTRELNTTGILVVIGGHSLGGPVVLLAAEHLIRFSSYFQLSASVFGSKRPCVKPKVLYYDSYVAKGDIVPLLPPWRPKLKKATVIGKWKPFWLAHQPKNYEGIMKDLGLKE